MDHDGFSLDKLLKVQEMLNYEKCDLLDVLEYIAYHTTPLERQQRVAMVKPEIIAELGSLGEINKVFVGFQKELYAA